MIHENINEQSSVILRKKQLMKNTKFSHLLSCIVLDLNYKGNYGYENEIRDRKSSM